MPRSGRAVRSPTPRKGPAVPYMRVTRAQFDPAVADELAPLIPDFIAAVQQFPGFQHVQSGFDRESGMAITVITFDTQEHAAAPVQDSPVNARLQALGMRLESREVYEVTV